MPQQEGRLTFRPEGRTLYVVSTPIGNLKDITVRAIEILANVDLIAAEDTRHSRKLLQHYDIKTPTTSYYDFNKEKKLPALIERLEQGQSLALISDAGTPGISDPAYRLVRACIENDLRLETAPGATAFVPALLLSGLPTDRFVFEGFLPPKKGRRKRIEALAEETRTIVLYESPYRVVRTLRDLAAMLGNRNAAVVREISKKFEQTIRGTLEEIVQNATAIKLKGEFVLVIGGKKSD